MTLTSWLSAMQKTSRRQMVLSNLVFDLVHARARKTDITEVVRRVAVKWTEIVERGEEKTTAPERILREVVDEVVPGVLCGGPDVKSGGAKLARVTGAAGWYDFTINTPIAKRDEVPDDVLLDFQNHGIPPNAIRPGAEVRGEWPEAWVTRAKDLDDFCATCADPEMLAASVRDFLGLIHYDDDHQLVRIDYPDGAVGKHALKVPTFLDGCGTRVFRSLTAKDTWGRTVNLADSSEGAPEAVHAPIAFTASFRVTYLGRIAGRTHQFTYRELVSHCPRRWEPHDEQLIDPLLQTP